MRTFTKTVTEIAGIGGADWDGAFWFAVLSPVLGVLTGFLALLLFFR
jgi:hypothetical protein